MHVIFLLFACIGILGTIDGLRVVFNPHDFLTGGHSDSIQTLLEALDMSGNGMIGLVKMLMNDYTSIHDLYYKSCKCWTAKNVDELVRWLPYLTPLQLDALLHLRCLQNIPMYQALVPRLLDASVPFEFISTLNQFNEADWIRYLKVKRPEYASTWCRSIEPQQISPEFTKAVDLLYMMDTNCLNGNFANKKALATAMSKQLPRSRPSSISQFLLNMRKVDTHRLLNLRRSVKAFVCKRISSESTFHLLNAKYLNCEWARRREVGPSFVNLITNGHTPDLIVILALRLFNELFGPEMLRGSLSVLKVIRKLPESRELFLLCDELSAATLNARREILGHFSVNYDEFLLLIPKYLYSSRFETFRAFDMSFRFKYHRKWGLYPGFADQDPTLLIPKPLPMHTIPRQGITEAILLEHIHSIIENSPYYEFHQGSSISNVPKFRPRIWTHASELETLFNYIMLYLIRFGKPAVVLDPTYCAFLTNPTGLGDLLAEDHLFFIRYKANDTVRDRISQFFHMIRSQATVRAHRMIVKRQEPAIRHLISNWSLFAIVGTRSIYSLLASQSLDNLRL